MFLSIELIVDLIQKIIYSLVIISLIVSGGWGLILRVVLSPLKIKASSREFKKLDDYLLDLQLMKLHHGINVTNKNDAELVLQAISQGILSRGDFKLLRFAPPIGLKRSKLADVWLAGFMGIVSITTSIGIISSLKESKYNHALYSQEKERVLISHSDIYDIQSGRYLLKIDCKNINSDSKSILASACGYLLTEDNDRKEELSWAIKRNNNAIISLMTIMVVLLIVGVLSFVLTSQYCQINNKFHDFKFGKHTQ
ncbi:hypothetical protein NOG67_00390 [Erwinia persicina]|uniref:hypothetical protein n=1 Tax=Erwinia persicina TaxID=55211 RepID=UPI0021074FE8|nr:hypothetical protein [Erwinia persicina]MCQ4107097.1 hypothetical protein [Erwinia persicina]UTX13015.1 hypothetical protein NOG67_00390 [Erwinia persicina]